MLSIDLLRGQGIPMKSRPGGAALLAVSIAVPLIVTMILLGNYVRGTIIISTYKQSLIKIERRLVKLSIEAVYDEDNEKEIDDVNLCFDELHDALKSNIQWSPILEIIARKLPETLVLSEMSVIIVKIRKMVPRRNDLTKKISILSTKNILMMSLMGKVDEGDRDAVLKFKQQLEASPFLKNRIDIRIVSHATSENDENIMFYEIACTFKKS